MLSKSTNKSNKLRSIIILVLQEYRLGAATIFTHVAREMAKHQRYSHVGQLLGHVDKEGYGDDDTVDEIIGACIIVIADKPNEVLLGPHRTMTFVHLSIFLSP